MNAARMLLALLPPPPCARPMQDIFWPPSVPYLQLSDPRFRLLNLHCFGHCGVLVAHMGPPFAAAGIDSLGTDQEVTTTTVPRLSLPPCASRISQCMRRLELLACRPNAGGSGADASPERQLWAALAGSGGGGVDQVRTRRRQMQRSQH